MALQRKAALECNGVCLFISSPVADLSKLLEEAEKPAVSLQNEEKPRGLDLLGTFTTSVRVSGMVLGFLLIFWERDGLGSEFKTYADILRIAEYLMLI